jgi:hypothetical protein
MKTPARKSAALKPAAKSKQIHARKHKSREAQFVELLRRKCMRAAGIGALTAAVEAVPGLGRLARLVFGEVLDAKLLSQVQRELIEETFALYEVRLPTVVQSTLVEKVQLLGTGASIGGDAFLRAMLKRVLGRVGGLLIARALPVVPIITSASTNAAVTYAIGKRAQAVARLRDMPVAAMPDALRAFTGIDERRIYAWSVAAVKDALGATGRLFGRIAKLPAKLPSRKRTKPRAAKR